MVRIIDFDNFGRINFMFSSKISNRISGRENLKSPEFKKIIRISNESNHFILI